MSEEAKQKTRFVSFDTNNLTDLEIDTSNGMFRPCGYMIGNIMCAGPCVKNSFLCIEHHLEKIYQTNRSNGIFHPCSFAVGGVVCAKPCERNSLLCIDHKLVQVD